MCRADPMCLLSSLQEFVTIGPAGERDTAHSLLFLSPAREFAVGFAEFRGRRSGAAVLCVGRARLAAALHLADAAVGARAGAGGARRLPAIVGLSRFAAGDVFA